MKPSSIRRRETELHTLLRQLPGSIHTIREFLNKPFVEEVVNSKSANGQTPLMIACLAGHVEAVELLLAHGAIKTLNAHSRKRRTAADYAAEHGCTELSLKLRNLAVVSNVDESRSETSLVLPAPATSKDGIGISASSEHDVPRCAPRCRLCGDRLAAVSKFHTMRDACFRGEVASPLIRDFFDMTSAKVIDKLSVPELHLINRRHNFNRELTESLAMVHFLRKLTTHGQPGSEHHESDEVWHVIDLCCGKSYTAALVAACFPHFRVTAIDRWEPQFLPHYDAAGISNIHYERLDVLAPTFRSQVEELITRADQAARSPTSSDAGDPQILRPLRTVVLGMHLCGDLSLAAIDLYRELPRIEALVLAPCCLPNAKKAALDLSTGRGRGVPLTIYTGADQNAKYGLWCDFLEAQLNLEFQTSLAKTMAASDGSSLHDEASTRCCMRVVMSDLVSSRNTLMFATKSLP